MKNGKLLVALSILFAVMCWTATGWCALRADYFLQEHAAGKMGARIYSENGGEQSQDDGFRVDYWNIPKVVAPGQTVNSSLAYTMLTAVGTGSVVYKTVLAEWQPNSPIAVLENGEIRGPARSVRKDFSFTAPTTPGEYRIRLAMTWAYQGIEAFYGEGPCIDAWNPGVGQWAEVTLKVENPSHKALVTPNGGENWIAGTTHNIQWQTSDPCISQVKIELSTNNGLSWADVNTVPNSGSYNWVVPKVTSNKCLVRISDANDANVYDISDKTFIIFECQLSSKADLNGDCKVDFIDLAIMAQDWLKNGNPYDENFTEPRITLVSINDPGVSGHEGFNGQMSKYETTNAQYCQFLNAAKASGDITVDGSNVLGASGSNSGEDFVGEVYYDLAGAGTSDYGATNGNGGAARIHYSGGVFTISDSNFVNHPVTYVTWYGATAFCNYYGYRLPTEWEWQAVADYDGSFIYGCGTSINNNIANYFGSTHPDGTTIVGAFGTYGYGMCDMAGNVWEWTSSIINGSGRVVRGGCWGSSDYPTHPLYVSHNSSFSYPEGGGDDHGFRVCR